MRRTLACFGLLVLACTSSAPPHPFNDLVGSPNVVTLTNLHPDEGRSRLFAVNYQQAGLIPVCTTVALLELDAERLRFRNEATGKTYEYYYHKAAGEPFPDHLTRYFGTDCQRASIAALAKIDREGIAQGKALVGMSKGGVIFAIGYPPRHVTPSLDSQRWVYWRNRVDRVAVVFDESGSVTNIEN